MEMEVMSFLLVLRAFDLAFAFDFETWTELDVAFGASSSSGVKGRGELSLVDAPVKLGVEGKEGELNESILTK
jgi:hypothetical protein